MTTIDYTIAAALHRKAAAIAEQSAQESFERSDTDGFLSQWASGLTAQKHRLDADILEDGGTISTRALFDLNNTLVPAKLINTRYGLTWALLESADPDSGFVGFVNRSSARSAARRDATMAKRGYREGFVRVPARADIGGSGKGLSGAASAYVYAKRTDGGFSADAPFDGWDTENRD